MDLKRTSASIPGVARDEQPALEGEGIVGMGVAPLVPAAPHGGLPLCPAIAVTGRHRNVPARANGAIVGAPPAMPEGQ